RRARPHPPPPRARSPTACARSATSSDDGRRAGPIVGAPEPCDASRTHAIRLEASTVCQLACPLCPTPEGTIKARIGAGFLKLDAFRRLVDANPAISRIELSNWGEI